MQLAGSSFSGVLFLTIMRIDVPNAAVAKQKRSENDVAMVGCADNEWQNKGKKVR